MSQIREPHAQKVPPTEARLRATTKLNRAWNLILADVLEGKHESLLPGLQAVFQKNPDVILRVEESVSYQGRPAKGRVDFSTDLTEIRITGSIPHLQTTANAVEIVGHELRHLTRANQRLPEIVRPGSYVTRREEDALDIGNKIREYYGY